MKLIDEEHYTEALAILDHVLDLEPEHFDALEQKGKVLIRLEDFKEALQTYILITGQSAEPRAWETRGWLHSKLNQLFDALYCFSVAQTNTRDRIVLNFDLNTHMYASSLNEGMIKNNGKTKKEINKKDEPSEPPSLKEILLNSSPIRPQRENIILENLNRIGQKVTVKRLIEDRLNKITDHMVRSKPEVALKIIDGILEKAPDNRKALHKKARIQFQLEDYENALITLEKIDDPDLQARALKELGRYDQALDLLDEPSLLKAQLLYLLGQYEQALKLNLTLPEDRETLHNRGLILAKLDRNEEALESLNKACSPSDKELFKEMGMIYLKTEEYQKALNCFSKINKKSLELLEATLKAQQALNLNKGLIKTLEAITKLDPERTDAYYQLGLLLMPDKPKKALKVFEKAIEKGHKEARLHKADILITLKKTDTALETLNKILSESPENFKALSKKGFILETTEPEQALKVFKLALKIKDDPDINLHMARILKDLDRSEQALNICNKALSTYPQKDFLSMGTGLAIQLDDPEKAIEFLTCLLDKDPENIRALSTRAKLNMSLERFNQADSDLKQLISLKPGDIDLYFNRGNALFKLKDFEQALEVFNSGLKLDSKDFRLNYACYLTLKQLEEYDRALLKLNQLLKIHPQETPILKEKASLLLSCEQHEQANEQCNLLLEKNPEDIGLLLIRARALCGLKESEQAKQVLERVVEIEPGQKEAAGMLESINC